jgi:hypothetical protein
MPDKNHKVSLFIPIFNEKDVIERYIDTLGHIFKKIPVAYEIFIVNDASQDNVKQILKKIHSSNREVTLLNYDIGPTRRENLAQSFNKATGDIVVFVDVDLAASLSFLQSLIDQVISGYDIATGSRYVTGSRIKRKPFRWIISVIYNAFVRVIFQTKIRDHMCGFKAFKRDVILRLVDEMGYDKTFKRGVFWDTELLVRSVRHGYRIKEVPIRWDERNESKLYFIREVKTLGYIMNFIMKSKRRN